MASTISAGTTSGTAIAIAGDTSGQLELKTNNGTTAVTVTTAQLVGVGTTSPLAKLDVRNTNQTTSQEAIISAYSTDSQTVDFGGSIALGGNADIPIRFGLISGRKENSTANNRSGYLQFCTFENGVGLPERMRITSAGEVLVGATTVSVGEKMKVAGSNNVFVVRCGNTNGAIVTSNASGTASYSAAIFCNNGDTYSGVGTITVSGSSTAYNTSSDYRLKENVLPMTDALDTVSALKPVTYKWKVDGSNGQGFIAHELQEVVPNAVTGEKDAVETYTDEDGKEQTRIKPQGIDTSFLVATLTAAIQELNAKVDAQALEIQALKGTA